MALASEDAPGMPPPPSLALPPCAAGPGAAAGAAPLAALPAEAVSYFTRGSPACPLDAHASGASGDLEGGSEEALRPEEEAHQRLVEEWSGRLGAASAEAQLPLAAVEEAPAVELHAPRLVRATADKIELTCYIQDLEYRLLEYVLEVHSCDGPQGAAPARVYYARLGEQRKVDEVAFEVPSQRPTGQTLWEAGRRYQFRIVGRCVRCSWLPFAPWQVVSEWSEASVISPLPRGAARRRSSWPQRPPPGHEDPPRRQRQRQRQRLLVEGASPTAATRCLMLGASR